MEYRLKLSTRALREVGETREWYEQQSTGLGEQFLAQTELQLEKIRETPLLYAEPISNVRCWAKREAHGGVGVSRSANLTLAQLSDASRSADS